MRKLLLAAIVLGTITVSSCDKRLDRTLFGTWNVTKVEGTLNVNDNSVFTAVDENPTGVIEFKSNGSGRQNYTFTLGGTTYDQEGEFSWQATAEEITIERVSDPDMVWTRSVDTENRQVASYNIIVDATENWDYTLTLEK